MLWKNDQLILVLNLLFFSLAGALVIYCPMAVLSENILIMIMRSCFLNFDGDLVVCNIRYRHSQVINEKYYIIGPGSQRRLDIMINTEG